MPRYRRKDQDAEFPDITAQQWNKPGDVPPWAYGIVKEHEDGFSVPESTGGLVGRCGDYLFKKKDGKPGIIRKGFFEDRYTLVDELQGRTSPFEHVENSITPAGEAIYRTGNKHIPFIAPQTGDEYNAHDLCIFNNVLFCCTDKGVFRLDSERDVMVHVPLSYKEAVTT